MVALKGYRARPCAEDADRVVSIGRFEHVSGGGCRGRKRDGIVIAKAGRGYARGDIGVTGIIGRQELIEVGAVGKRIAQRDAGSIAVEHLANLPCGIC